MSIRSEAEENLRVIRNLMEKATIYRAISAPGALIGGVCALSIGWVAVFGGRSPDRISFFGAWLGALAITSAANFWLLYRDAARRGEAFVSPGMRLALRAMLPALIGGGICSFVQGEGGSALVASLWVLFYGVSLLAAAHFAPKSINWLGRAFFVAGAALLASGAWVFDWWSGTDQTSLAHSIMGVTFGGFHIVYAVCTWQRKVALGGKS